MTSNIPENNSIVFNYEALAYLHGMPDLSADLKTQLEDFIVTEVMPVELSGEGEHIWLKITKKGSNTDYVACQLAAFAGVKEADVSYAGLKDRYAVTTQWFSVQMPGQDGPDWFSIQHDEFTVDQVGRHSRKLKRGTLSSNEFEICLRNLTGEQQFWQQRLELIRDNGVPNYFGLQRFGHDMGNLSRSLNLIQHNKLRRLKPHKRSIYLSAMRSWLFNQVVSNRIDREAFEKAQDGDVYMLAESQACFSEPASDAIQQRLLQHELNLTAPLWGRGRAMSGYEVAAAEQLVADTFADFAKALEMAGMKQERRAMRLLPVKMRWEFQADNCLVVYFELTKGSYATGLLRELCVLNDKSLPEFK